MVAAATAKYQTDAEPARGIIPLAVETINPHDTAIFTVASMIDHALTGPAIGIYDTKPAAHHGRLSFCASQRQ